MSVSIIIPFLDEEANIPQLVPELEAFAAGFLAPVEVVFVDDGSTDLSVQLLLDMRPQHFTMQVVRLSKNYGAHAALRAGLQHATGEHSCNIYADLQDPLSLVTQMWERANEGNHIVWAIRNSNPAESESVFSNVYTALMRKYVSGGYSDKGFDVFMVNRHVREHLNDHVEAHSSIFLQILLLGYRQSRVRYDKQPRKAGKSKWTVAKKVKLFIDSFAAFSYYPIRLVSVMGIAFFLLGMLWTAYVVTRQLVLSDLDPGWPTIVAILMIGFGITNIGLGIIAEYLWRTLDVSRNRPVFLVQEVHTDTDIRQREAPSDLPQPGNSIQETAASSGQVAP
jgi:dolichol-phosphate mannosyltransferase